MAAPVVSGTVALMLQANPKLTPNLVKAILQYTAQVYPGYNSLRQGAGFLNALGAVKPRAVLRQPFSRLPHAGAVGLEQEDPVGQLPDLGRLHQSQGERVEERRPLGRLSAALDGDNIIWGTDCADSACDNIIWGTVDDGFDNIIWGTDCDNIIWGTEFVGDNIIWGTDDADNIIWGTNCGGADCDNIIWGTDDSDNIIWGTADAGAHVAWLLNDPRQHHLGHLGRRADETWSSSGDEEVVFPDDEATLPVPDPAAEFGEAG